MVEVISVGVTVLQTHSSNSSPDSSLSSSSNHYRQTWLCLSSRGCSRAAAVYPTLVSECSIICSVFVFPMTIASLWCHLIYKFDLQMIYRWFTNLQIYTHRQYWQFPYFIHSVDMCAPSLSSSVLVPHHRLFSLTLLLPFILPILHGLMSMSVLNGLMAM